MTCIETPILLFRTTHFLLYLNGKDGKNGNWP